MTKIRTTDSRSRVTVSAAEGTTYAESIGEDGTITLTPLDIPPIPARGSRLIFVRPHARGDQIFVSHETSMSLDTRADIVQNLKEMFQVPLVVAQNGFGGALADLLVERGVEVILTSPHAGSTYSKSEDKK